MNDSPSLRKLAAQLAAVQSKLETVEQWMTCPQLPHSSLDDASVPEKDAEGKVVSRWGKQPDGTHGVVDYEGPIPPPPAVPVVAGGPGLLTVTYGGVLAGPRPLDLARVEAYASPEPFEYLEDADLLGSITGRDGGRLTVARDPGEWYVGLVSVSRAEKRSLLSPLASVEVSEAGDSEAVERLARAFHTDTRPPTPEDAEGRPEGAYWTMLDATGAETARWRLVDSEWVDAPISPEFIPEAYVDFLGANQGLIQQLMTHDVDLGGSLRAEQETYGLELTARGIDMSSQGLAYLGDRLPLPGSARSLNAIRYNLIVTHDAPDRENYLAIYDSRTGETVREIHAGSGHTFSPYPYFDVENEWIWVGRNTPDPNYAAVDLVAFDLLGNQVESLPVGIGHAHFAVSDSYVVADGGSVEQGGTDVYDRAGNFLRFLPYDGPRYSPTDLAIRGDVVYDRFGSLITLTDMRTGLVEGDIQLPEGYQSESSRSGPDWIHTVQQWATGAWYVVVVNLETNTITQQLQFDLGGNKRMSGASRSWNDIFVATDQDGLWALEKRDPFRQRQTQASIDTITGSVAFNNARLSGVTVTDAIYANQIFASQEAGLELPLRTIVASPINRFHNLSEADAFFAGQAWVGTEITTASNGVEKWIRATNPSGPGLTWVRTWSEGYDQGAVFFPSLPGWNVGQSYYEVRSGWAFLAIDLQRTGSALGSGNNPLWTLPQEALPASHLFTDVMNQGTRENLLLEINVVTRVIGLITTAGAVSTNNRIRRFTSWPIAT